MKGDRAVFADRHELRAPDPRSPGITRVPEEPLDVPAAAQSGNGEGLIQVERARRVRARTAREIFEWLVTEHGAAHVSYSTVRDYLAGRRTLRPRPRRTTAPAQPDPASPPGRNIPATMSPAHLAVEHGDLPGLRDLLDAGHDEEDDNGDGWTLLRHAVNAEYDTHAQTSQPLHADATTFLLAGGADPMRPCNAVTVVSEAEIRGHWLAAEIMRAWTGRQE